MLTLLLCMAAMFSDSSQDMRDPVSRNKVESSQYPPLAAGHKRIDVHMYMYTNIFIYTYTHSLHTHIHNTHTYIH